MKILAGHSGQLGDLFMNLPFIRWLRSYNERGMTKQYLSIDMPINRKYAEAAPLFFNHPHLDGIMITDAYDGFPSEIDSQLMERRGYDQVFPPMQPHVDKWWEKRHQASTVLYDYSGGQFELSDSDCQISLVKWFDVPEHKDTIAFAPFAGFYNPKNDKKLSTERAQEIVDMILKMGYDVLQIGGPGEPILDGATQLRTPYFDSIRHILGCKAFLHTDTGAAWAISGYQFPALGVYSHRYYGPKYVKNIQPINPNAMYLDAPNVNEIELIKIERALKDLTK
jgi:ADP-heptose:LPS heptosyltransferase